MRLKNSFWVLLGREAADADEVTTESVRKEMLAALDVHCQQPHITLDNKVSAARSSVELWYLRPDLMHAIAQSAGERVATDVLTSITALFKDPPPATRLHKQLSTLHARPTQTNR